MYVVCIYVVDGWYWCYTVLCVEKYGVYFVLSGEKQVLPRYGIPGCDMYPVCTVYMYYHIVVLVPVYLYTYTAVSNFTGVLYKVSS